MRVHSFTPRCRRLAGAVRANQHVHGAFGDLQVDALQCIVAAVALDETVRRNSERSLAETDELWLWCADKPQLLSKLKW
jgi:hypothetical protein